MLVEFHVEPFAYKIAARALIQSKDHGAGKSCSQNGSRSERPCNLTLLVPK